MLDADLSRPRSIEARDKERNMGGAKLSCFEHFEKHRLLAYNLVPWLNMQADNQADTVSLERIAGIGNEA